MSIAVGLFLEACVKIKVISLMKVRDLLILEGFPQLPTCSNISDINYIIGIFFTVF